MVRRKVKQKMKNQEGSREGEESVEKYEWQREKRPEAAVNPEMMALNPEDLPYASSDLST